MTEDKAVIRQTDAEAVRLAKTLLRTARFGALAAIDPDDAWPLASRVGVATAVDGTPVILTSSLSTHTQALLKDPRCALLVGEPGKGDPLAHPRMTVVCTATRLERGAPDEAEPRRRYLARHPKAQLYAGLGDFSFFRLEIVRANLNGGFGKAYRLSREDLLCAGPVAEFSALEPTLAAQVGEPGSPVTGSGKRDAWRVVGVDPEGIDLMAGDQAERVCFLRPLERADEFAQACAALRIPDPGRA